MDLDRKLDHWWSISNVRLLSSILTEAFFPWCYCFLQSININRMIFPPMVWYYIDRFLIQFDQIIWNYTRPFYLFKEKNKTKFKIQYDEVQKIAQIDTKEL